MAAILNFGSRTSSGNVGSDIAKSGMVGNAGIAVGIAAPSLAAHKLFPLPVFAGRQVEVGRGRNPWPLKSRRNLLPVKSCFQFRFSGRHLESEVTHVG